ncbi:hypothetical protein KVR01_007478 [Diaporthe batatas]|uniref:uncharacterized protein n=1 Tax=Diaporthe batatas TaxID=748121 RepID=UPI001D03F4ED|nr:uncharacterized protein KVR01_007478 [Diaporthe batatas]KAG8163000.1 hypothetical protein KVR01_007478 [Diaporthe batatas]
MQDESIRPVPITKSHHPFTCGVTGATYTHQEFFDRSERLSRTLANQHGWAPDAQTPWDKVACIFSLNTIDYMTAAYAVHRLSGIVTPANAVYTPAELAHQLTSSGSKALFTCPSLITTAVAAAEIAGLQRRHIYLLPVTGEAVPQGNDLWTLEDMISKGSSLTPVPPLVFGKGQGAEQPAFLCYSSGTSGNPKAVMISHRNVIANILQMYAYESRGRQEKRVESQVLLAPLPMSHIYALVVAAHVAVWRGDGFIILPKYELESFLGAIQRFKVQQILVVPPILLQILRSRDICAKYDLNSVRFLFSGAAPLGEETINEIKNVYPKWTIAQAYGMTETSVCVTVPSEHDIVPRASGSLLPDMAIKLLGEDGKEITTHDQPGEIYVRSPSVVLGYLRNDKANSETFISGADGRWIRTGDIGLMTKVPSGNEQLVIVDRIKEMIKVMGHQVAPAELEAHLLAHPLVADCAVIQIPDPKAGEVPKAFVVRSPTAMSEAEGSVSAALKAWVTDHKAPYKALRGGIEFVDVIPKSPSGKILRRELREREKGKLTPKAKL